MRALFLLLAVAGAAFAQADSGVIMITATRPMPVQFDSAAVQVQVTLPQTAGLDDAVAIVQPAGFTAADWSGISGSGYFVIGGNPPQPSTVWNFSKTIPVTDVPKTLTALQSKPASGVYYSVGTASSQPPECNYAALIGDAQSQAAKIAEAAGMRLGGIVSLVKGADVELAQIPTAVSRTGNFSGVVPISIYDPLVGVSVGTFSYASLTTVPVAPACSLMVQFKVVG